MDELQSLYDSLNSDLIEAKKLQQSLVSEHHRDFGTAQVSLLLQSCGHVGGDLVGMFPINDHQIGLYGIDVSGHGISSALMTARVAGYLSAVAPDQNLAITKTTSGNYTPRPPDETIAELNKIILEEIETEHYFTLLLAYADMETGKITMSQAGHPHPVLQRADGTTELIGTGGLPVGLIDGAEYQRTEAIMSAGDRLLICSDGVVECSDPDGKFLGDDGLMHICAELRDMRGTRYLESLMWKMSQFTADRGFDDDVSAVLFEFKPTASSG